MSCDSGDIGPDADGADQVDEFAQSAFVEDRGGRSRLGRTALSRGLSFSMASIASSMSLPISGFLACGLEFGPASDFGHPEDPGGDVLVPVLERLPASAWRR
jgi:hypothetical protein